MPVPRLNQQAGRSIAELATLFSKWPEQNAPAKQFFEALTIFDEATAESPSSAQALIWPLWRRVDFLDVSRRAVIVFAEDMIWLESREAGNIATRFASSFTSFPELAIVLDRDKVAQEIGRLGSGPKRVLYLAIALLIAPGNQGIVQNLLLELAEAGAEDLLLSFVDSNNFQQLDATLFARVITAISKKVSPGKLNAVLGSLAGKLERTDELARLRLGLAIERAGGDRSSGEGDPLRLAAAASHTRRLVSSKRGALTSGSKARMRSDLAASLARARQHFSRLKKPGSDTVSLNSSEDAASGVVSWVEYKSSEGARLYPADFAHEYGNCRSDGPLVARYHPGDAHLLKSHFPLGPGSYAVSFWGTSAAGLKVTFSAVGDEGQVLARATVLSVKTLLDDSKLHELSFAVSRRAGVEISLLVGAGSGEVTISRIEVRNFA